MERVWMYDGGLLSVSTHKGAVNLENVVMFGHYGSIVVETHAADITITLNARYFNGAFNLQSEKGLVYIDPGMLRFCAYGEPLSIIIIIITIIIFYSFFFCFPSLRKVNSWPTKVAPPRSAPLQRHGMACPCADTTSQATTRTACREGLACPQATTS